ncbi:hypothetical protein QNA24_22355 [Rhodococcus qingshengii]|uniref:hypothetical protein n=1 Tax=Rhodococcus qingshengii TaxID=334542 RepID=UPI0024BB9028|nr:hypothetical protein [Rhodococcus qingshengii]MDJ0489123.1 hypothetical protein [Rhodococcus qingshengii]
MSDITASIATAIQAKTGGNVEGKLPEWWAEFIGMVLAELQSAGRLIPAGGMALTAEQVEDVRTVAWYTGAGLSRAPMAEIHRLRALFPATEPAEGPRELICPCRGRFGFHDCNTVSTPAEPTEEHRSFLTIQDVPNNTLFHTHGGEGSSLFVRNQSGDLRLCLNAGPEWSKLLRDGDFPPSSGPFVEVSWSKFPQPPADPFAQPAPAEPAEEETKAEACAGGGGMHPCVLAAGHAGVHTDSRGLRWNNPTSSPVVPAPTEAGPWA